MKIDLSRFQDYKENINEKLNELGARLNDVPAIVQLRERYEALNPLVQKSLKSLAFLFFIYFFTLSGQSSLTEAQDYLQDYSEKREKMQELVEVQKDAAKSALPATMSLSLGELETWVRGQVDQAKLIPEQVRSLGPKPMSTIAANSLIPSALSGGAVMVSLKGLNIRQWVDLGGRFSSYHPLVKLTRLEVTPTSLDSVKNKSGYFDVDFVLVLLKGASPKAKQGGSFDRNKKSRNQDDEDGF